jgi:cytidylate kinase
LDFVIAVDGPAASGKGTVAAQLAAAYALPYLDTGILYRATGVAALAAGGSPEDPVAAEAAARRLRLEDIDPEAIRTAAAGEAASQAGAHPGVRAALIALQRDFALRPARTVS